MKPVSCQYILPNFSLESCTHWHFLRHCVRGSVVFILWKERLPCSRPHISLQKVRGQTWPARLWGLCPLCRYGCLWLAPASPPLLVSTSPACFRPWRCWFSSSTWSQHRLLCLLWDRQETGIQRNIMKGLVGYKNTIPHGAGSGVGAVVYVLWIIKVLSHKHTVSTLLVSWFESTSYWKKLWDNCGILNILKYVSMLKMSIW